VTDGKTGGVDRYDELVALSHDDDPKVRCAALKELCPCHIRTDVREAWDRILQMTDDPSPMVRRAVVHTLADGSPRHREAEVLSALETMRNDPDKSVRKRVRMVLGAYHRTGRVNVL
jgi:HEAT repeat protein